MASLRVLFIFTVAASAAQVVNAHGGGLNAEGCHHNRSTGDYHCHGGGSALRNFPTYSGGVRGQNAISSGVQPRAYANCTEARAAGAAPIRRGEPGYGPHLDRDNDGIACEPYRGR